MAEMLMPGRAVTLVGVMLSVALFPYATRASDSCFTKTLVRKNGEVVIEGKVYSDQAALKGRIADLKSRKPDCFVNLTSEKGTSIKTIEHVALVLRDMGVSSVGFLTEPNSDKACAFRECDP
jgi:biopolymer transport protein ExbD